MYTEKNKRNSRCYNASPATEMMEPPVQSAKLFMKTVQLIWLNVIYAYKSNPKRRNSCANTITYVGSYIPHLFRGNL